MSLRPVLHKLTSRIEFFGYGKSSFLQALFGYYCFALPSNWGRKPHLSREWQPTCAADTCATLDKQSAGLRTYESSLSA
jgi:hypothetical protein